jgi:hypothetical protein
MDRRVVAALGLFAAVPLGGCDPKALLAMSPLEIEMKIADGDFYPYKGKATKTETTLDCEIDAEVGGLDGTYTITLNNPEGGTFGSFTGTAVVKKGRIATVVAKDTPELMDAVEAMVFAATGESITVEKAKAKVKGSQVTGGIEPTYKAKITFSGVTTGSGNKVRGGKILGGQTFEENL